MDVFVKKKRNEMLNENENLKNEILTVQLLTCICTFLQILYIEYIVYFEVWVDNEKKKSTMKQPFFIQWQNRLTKSNLNTLEYKLYTKATKLLLTCTITLRVNWFSKNKKFFCSLVTTFTLLFFSSSFCYFGIIWY